MYIYTKYTYNNHNHNNISNNNNNKNNFDIRYVNVVSYLCTYEHNIHLHNMYIKYK